MILPVTIFLAAVAYLPGVGSATVAGRWAVLAFGAALILVGMDKPRRLRYAHCWGLALLLWAALGATWSVSLLDTAGELWHWAVLAVLFAAAHEYRSPDRILFALILGLAISVPFVVTQIQGYSWVQVFVDAQPSGLFLNRNVMGELAACALVWSLASGRMSLALVPLFMVLMSDSRGALLACLCGGLYWLWHSSHRWWTVPVALSFALGVIVMSLDRLDSIYARLDIWTLALNNITLLGRGLETFGTLAPLYEYAHNDYIQLVFELGVGAILVVPLLAYALGGRRSSEGAALAALLGAALVSYPLHHPMGAALVAVTAGLACGLRGRTCDSEHLLRDCSITRAEYEQHDSAGEVCEPCSRGQVVAF